MEITIKNCNNIKYGLINITSSKLNVKFGINGSGKSTIAKAIEYKINSPTDLVKLRPFRLIESDESGEVSEVAGTENLKSVLIFNEHYLNQFVFRQDELVQNSFEIFIKTPSYIKKIERIESIISDIKKVFKDDAELIKIIEDLQNLSDSFKSTQSGISQTSAVAKGLVGGNKIEHLPEGLDLFRPFLKNEKCVSWLDWHLKGGEFLVISRDCPFCASPIDDKINVIKKVAEEYDKDNIKKLSSIIRVINNLGEYFSKETGEILKKITSQKDGLVKDQNVYLYSVKTQIQSFVEKLRVLQGLSFTNFNDVEKVIDFLRSLKIDFKSFDHLKSNKTETVIESINNSLDIVLKEAGELQGEVNKQKFEVRILIEKYQKEINQFLKNAGYKYFVSIVRDGGEYRLKLQHYELKSPLKGGAQHLSFGERNAFALVLFMYEALSKDPSLIILDDPISSFDKNKKYAIMDMLFRSDDCFKEKTVLMLTHDMEPIIDTVKVIKQFNNLVEASFLKLNNGILTEKMIINEDILTFSQICKKVLSSAEDDIIKLIYLRRDYEILDNRGDEYQVLSNLFHKRTEAEAVDFRKEKDDNKLDKKQFDRGVNNIKGRMNNSFNYEKLLSRICNLEEIKKLYSFNVNGYIKLQLFRLLFRDDDSFNLGEVIRKFINESYHIENEFISQLNPIDFDLIPGFIIEECDKYVSDCK